MLTPTQETEQYLLELVGRREQQEEAENRTKTEIFQYLILYTENSDMC